jgi:hypothetical protein
VRGFDHASNAAYAVTIIDGQLHPSWLGRTVEWEWQRSAKLRRGVPLDAVILLLNDAVIMTGSSGMRHSRSGSGTISSTIPSNGGWIDMV